MRPLCLFLTASSSLLLCQQSHANRGLDLIDKSTGEDSNYVAPAPARIAFEESKEKEVEKKAIELKTKPWDEKFPHKIILHKNERNKYIQQASIGGFAEFGFQSGDFPDDESFSEARLRRLRLDAMLKIFYNTTIEVSTLHNGELGYEGIDRLTARIQLRDNAALTVGKFRPGFTNHYAVAPEKRKVSTLPIGLNQIVPSNSLGIFGEYQGKQWDYGFGFFSSDSNKNIPDIEGKGYALGHIGHTFAKGKGEPHIKWNLDYIYNFEESRSKSIAGGQRQLISTGLVVETEKSKLVTDFTLAHGGSSEASTIWDLSVTGSRWILDKQLELIGQYEYTGSSDDAGLNAGFGISDPRADSLNPGLGQQFTAADELHRFYMGLNYHLLYEYALLTTAVEYRILRTENTDTYSDWLFHAGLRFAF